MKAITCSQCGGLITQFKVKDSIADCEFCGARIPIVREKIVYVTAKEVQKRKLRKLSDEEKSTVFTSFEDDHVPFVDYETKKNIIIAALVLVAIVVGVILMKIQFNRDKEQDRRNRQRMETTTGQNLPKSNNTSAQPVPIIN